ncbi:serine-rich adhesin for platelets-like [Pempheris klunzingeri]|uniref:serine-rich adhesin for platelets-like n=1 Tax=Pempheris klunzingeri TaxID=3127111 RepID=UPI00397EA4D2
MEASPFSYTPERYWTEEKERALIAFFSKHSCLWNHKSESYKNRQLRWKTLEHLRILLSAHPPPVHFTVEDIKNKFKNLRTTFQRQYKMVKASKVCRSDDVFVPQWKHYQQLMFLQGCWDQDDGPDEPPLSPLTVPQEESQPTLMSPGQNISFLPTPSTSSPSSSSSSCVPSNTMVKCYWTEERERALIAFYSEHNCLWNKKSENHNNRQLRLKLLEALRSQLSDHSVSFTVEDIKCKFKNLRTVFNREYKVVQASRASDKLYVSKWKHYQQLLFLCESCDEDDSPDDLLILEPQEDKDLEYGSQTPSSTLSSLSSSSTQPNSFIRFNNPSAPSSSAKTNASAAYQVLLSASPEKVKLVSQTTAPTLPASPSTSRSDSKSCTNPSPLSLSASGSVQPDSRLSTDSRCHWNEAKVQQLISFYSEHICLWNHKSESYRNRLLRQSLLETLSSLLSDSEPVPFTVEDIKTKFRNLRTIFQREHKAVSSNKTCGSEDFYFPKWKHYRELMFLCDSCDEDEQPEDFRFHEPQESSLLHLDGQAPPSSLHYHGRTQTVTKLNITSRSLAAPPSPTPPDSQHSSPSSSPSTSSSHTDNRVSGRKRASRRLPPTTSEVLGFMRTFCHSQTVSPHAGFLKYVEECLNETPPDKVKKLKKKIIETIHSVSEEG